MEGLAQWKGVDGWRALIKGAGWMEVPDWRVAGRLTGGVWMEGSGWMEGWGVKMRLGLRGSMSRIASGLGGGGRRGLDKGGWMDGGAWMEGRWMEEA